MRRRAFLTALAAAPAAPLAAVLPSAHAVALPHAPRRGRRVAVSPLDPGYTPHYLTVTVYLDGEKLNNCVMADEALGEVVCYAEPHRIDPWTLEPALEVRRGRVQIFGLPDSPPAAILRVKK